jgi:hypothetical protein
MSAPRTTRFLTRTAILLALTLVFQVFGKDIAVGLGLLKFQNFIVGPLVNLCLLVATAFAGIWAGVAVAVLSPLGAYATGTVFEPLFLIVIALGNLIFVLTFAVADHAADSLRPRGKLISRGIGILIGAILKTAWLWGGILIYSRLFTMVPAIQKAYLFAFSWPQAVTAVVGGILALLILKPLEKALPKL